MALDVANVSHIDLDSGVGVATPDAIPPVPWDSMVSDYIAWIIQIVVLIGVCGVISAAGLVANVINIIVFFRQGLLSSSSNVSLLALAFADIGCLLPTFISSVGCATMQLNPNTLFLDQRDFMEMFSLWQHVMFVQIASWITAYIAFERCMCVVFPMKVKMMFSARRSLVVVVIIAALFSISFIPVFATLRFVGVNDSVTNTIKLMFTPTKAFLAVITISDYIQSIFLRTSALLIVFICTQITVYYVKLSKSWRRSVRTSNPNSSNSDKTLKEHANSNVEGKGDDKTKSNSDTDKGQIKTTTTHSSKEERLVKMITLISIIFLVCNTPDIVAVYMFNLVPFFKTLSPMNNFFRILLSCQLVVESINSSINIVVYYRMSSRYKQELRAWLGLDNIDNST